VQSGKVEQSEWPRFRDRAKALFNPRRQRWVRQFTWDGARLVGLTACGRATIDVLNINAPYRIDLRELLIIAGRFPPE
jgi:hypothetical protein